MTSKTKKTILVSILGLALIAVFIGYKLYNKKHFSVENARPAASLSAADLHNTFVTDSLTAKTTFIGDEANQKVIEVTGEISSIIAGVEKHSVVKLKTATDGAFINCEMEGAADGFKAGDTITLKGICNGYLFEADLGIPGDVNMNRCIIIKK
jgi:tRNA_anti-like